MTDPQHMAGFLRCCALKKQQNRCEMAAEYLQGKDKTCNPYGRKYWAVEDNTLHILMGLPPKFCLDDD